ncbi:MAG: hypothetical protein K2U26_20515 [Cyclobacteriaceae bacterium]|nr:hypothetical protein [Cyclobacteriaceae bacterium]
MKFGVLILYFNAQRTILRCIENCAPFVDLIYVSYSPVPWTKYNSKARSYYKNTSDLEIVINSVHRDKIRIIQGAWDNEEEQRNAVVNQARLDGMNYLIIQDPDEFYLPEEYSKNIEGIIKNPHAPFYYNLWINFWKNIHTVIVERTDMFGLKNSIFSMSANFAINLSDFLDTKFVDRRTCNYDFKSGVALSGICYHLSYVYSDDELKGKIMTWGHSHQVSENWFFYKWLAWDQARTKYINPTIGPIWLRAIPFKGTLPVELMDFPVLSQAKVKLTMFQKLNEFRLDLRQLLKYYVYKFKGKVAFALKIGQFKGAPDK